MVRCCLMFVKQSEKMMVMLREKNSKERLCLIYVFFRFWLFYGKVYITKEKR